MKVLVCGDRRWGDLSAIMSRLEKLPAGTVIIEGGATGADRLAQVAAVRLGFVVAEYPAEWEKYGKRAGSIRNRRMLDEKPDLVIAFHSNLAVSRGTKDTVNEARRRGIPVEIIT